MKVNPEDIARAIQVAGQIKAMADTAYPRRPKFAAGGDVGYGAGHDLAAPIPGAPRSQAGGLPLGGGLPGGPGALQAPGGARPAAEADLEGLPKRVKVPATGSVVEAGHNPHIRRVAESYMRERGLPYNPPRTYAKVDPERAGRIASAFEEMEHQPEHPLVRAAYAALARETQAQYEHAKRHGFKAEFWDPETQEDPYGPSPRLAVEDVNKNNHMYVFPTHFGYGTGDIPHSEIAENPLLADSGERWNGHKVTVNDLFRAVHDYFGHAKEGVGFRHDGEENAWRGHMAMYSPLARLAATTETRGQNSWLNFGPHGESNRTAKTEDTVFAPQKIGVLPPWVHREGAEDFVRPEEHAEIERLWKLHGMDRQKRADGGRLLTPQGLYSRGAEAARALPQAKGTGQQMLASLKGVKPEELKWSGTGALAGEKSLTRDDLAGRFERGVPQIQETTLGSREWEPDESGDARPPKYGKYTIPVGDNYREVLMHLPRRENGGNFVSSHWDTPNVLAHLRLKDRLEQVAHGEPGKMLHLEELQSDWGQEGRQQGFYDPDRPYELFNTKTGEIVSTHPTANEAEEAMWSDNPRETELDYGHAAGDSKVPHAPYVGNTQHWTDLGLKRLLHEAAHGDYDKIVWTPGQDQAERYDLSKHIGSLEAHPMPEGQIDLRGYAPKDRHPVYEDDDSDPEEIFRAFSTPEDLHKHVGKEVAQRIMERIRFPHGPKTKYAVTHKLSGNAGLKFDTPEEAAAELERVKTHFPEPQHLEVRPHTVTERGQAAYLDTPDLKIGGEGMRGYYDNILPKRLLALAREHDPQAALGQAYLHPDGMGLNDTQYTTRPFPALTITPQMRESIKANGFPAFARGGDVERPARADGGQVAKLVRSQEPEPVEHPAAPPPAEPAYKPKRFQTVKNATGLPYPGIYGNPREMAQEAESRVAPESPALKRLFGVTRGEMHERGAHRRGNMEPKLPFKGGDRRSDAVEGVMQPRNERRLLDIIHEALQQPGLSQGMMPWYFMDPALHRLKELVPEEEALRRYRHFNTMLGMASPGSEVPTELNRGIAAHTLANQGRFEDFERYGGLGEELRGPEFPEHMRPVMGHPYHKTSQALPMRNYLDKGEIDMQSAKVPTYVAASGTPETGFQTTMPVADAHFTRLLGLGDTRGGTRQNRGKAMLTPEYKHLGPWFRQRVSDKAGIEAVPAQALVWGAGSKATGVSSPIGAPKLELLADHIMQVAKRHGISPEEARDKVLTGQIYNRGGEVNSVDHALRVVRSQ